MSEKKSFNSDNQAPALPEVIEALVQANTRGHSASYGFDDWTARAQGQFQALFGKQTKVFFVPSGTGANVLSLATFARGFDTIFVSDCSHLYCDEAGAPEKILGCKLTPISSGQPSQGSTSVGKISPEKIEPFLEWKKSHHHASPRGFSLTQTTEYGTLYSFEELRAFGEFKRRNELFFHMDGSRIANAVAATGLPAKEALQKMILEPGVDVLSFGGAKGGLILGEAIVILNPALAENFENRRKNHLQLVSKGRYLGAQFEAYLKNETWVKAAKRANSMAKRLFEGVRGVQGIEIVAPVEANVVFAKLQPEWARYLQAKVPFYFWDEPQGIVRWMTSWDHTEKEIDEFCGWVQGLPKACVQEPSR